MSDFKRNIAKLVGGTVSAQAIAFLTAPILTRLYTPADYGALGIYIALTTLFVMVATGRYHLAIVLPKSDDDARHIVVLCLLCTALCAGIATVAVWAGRDLMPAALGSELLLGVIWLAPVSVFARGTMITLQYWRNRREQFGANATMSVTDSICGSGIAIAAATVVTGFSPWLIIARVIGSVAAVLVGAFWKGTRILEFLPVRPALATLTRVAGEYRRFPLITSWSAVFNTLSYTLPVLVLAAIFSPDIVGFYTLAERIVVTPVAIFGGAVAQVLFTHSARLHQDGQQIAPVLEGTVVRLLGLGVVPMLTLALTAPTLFALVFGPEWREAGFFTQILAVYALMRFVSAPIANITSIYARQDIELRFNLVLLLSRCAALLYAWYSNDIVLALIALTVSSCVAYVYILGAVFGLVGASIATVARRQNKTWIAALVIIGVYYARPAGLGEVGVLIALVLLTGLFLIMFSGRDLKAALRQNRSNP